ncbi:MAG: hypothetical protein ACOCUI_04280 [bacterium]
MKVLFNNIDTLKIGFYADVNDEFLDVLEEKKNDVNNQGHNIKIKISNFEFYVLNLGIPRYSYVLNWKNGFQIKINERPKGDAYPNIMVRVSSYACHNMEYYDILLDILSKFADIDKEKVSEIHYSVDVTEFQYDYELHNNFAGAPRSDAIYRENSQITSAYIGSQKAPVFLRIYNKLEEIKTKKKGYWLLDKYQEELGIGNYLETDKDKLWRFEFECKRDFIKQFKIETFQDVLNKSNDIWRYLTEFRVNQYGEKMSAWVSFKDRSVSDRANLCPVLEFWEQISKVKWFSDDFTYQTRIRDRKINREQIEKQALGCLTTVAASMNLNLQDVFIYMKDLYKKNKSLIQEDLNIKNVAFQL